VHSLGISGDLPTHGFITLVWFIFYGQKSEEMKNIITSQVVIAYTHCKHKAYLLLCTNKKGIPHGYISNLADEARKNREEYIRRIKLKTSEILSYSSERFKLGNSIIVGAHLEFDDLTAYSDVLTKIEETSSTNQTNYTPTLVVGTHKISKAQRLQLAFIGYVLSKCQNKKPASGKIIGVGNKAHTIKLNNLYNEIEVVINKLRTWTSSQKPESPPVILNKHCLSCPFQQKCETEAKEHDHLSLLRGMTEREITVQNKKGIFTVNQFSYTYRPRKRKKNKGKHNPKYHHSLKALAIRDHKIYIVQKPKVPLSETLIFLDVEGIPDRSFYYLKCRYRQRCQTNFGIRY
jgi:predicted RecB family nuclease